MKGAISSRAVPMYWPKKDMALYRFFDFLNFDLEFLKGIQSFKALTGEIYVITNDLGGRQVFMFPEL
jgi:hypothetical protein